MLHVEGHSVQSENMKPTTLFLCADSSMLFGAARILDLGATFDVYNVSATGVEADARAIHSDWAMFGQDLQDSLNQFEAENSAR